MATYGLIDLIDNSPHHIQIIKLLSLLPIIFFIFSLLILLLLITSTIPFYPSFLLLPLPLPLHILFFLLILFFYFFFLSFSYRQDLTWILHWIFFSSALTQMWISWKISKQLPKEEVTYYIMQPWWLTHTWMRVSNLTFLSSFLSSFFLSSPNTCFCFFSSLFFFLFLYLFT